MARFGKPLNVFLSYSHEDRKLCDQFVKHLESLRRDGLINKWYDRNIKAGAKWEPEILTRLDSADLVICLISANFTSSEYCYDIEMQRAERRFAARECWVILVNLKPCDWTKELRQYQATPSFDKAITAQDNREEAFRTVVQDIRKVIEQLAAGQWPAVHSGDPWPGTRERRASNDALSLLAHLCNRTGQEIDIHEAFQGLPADKRQTPFVMVVPGAPGESHEEFVDRTRRDTLSELLEVQAGPLHRTLPVRWPARAMPDAIGYFHREVCASLDIKVPLDGLAEVGERLEPGLHTLLTAFTMESWSDTLAEAISAYASYWDRWGPLAAGKAMLVPIVVRCTNSDSTIKAKIVAALDVGRRKRLRGCVVEPLGLIGCDEALLWMTHREVRKHYRAECEVALKREIKKLFVGGAAVPMDRLAEELPELLDQHR